MKKFENPTKEQIAAWENETGRKVKQLEVDDKIFCFKQPDRHIVKAANHILVKTKSPDAYADVIIANCLLNGKEVVDTDDEVYFALQAKVDQIVTSKVGELKN